MAAAEIALKARLPAMRIPDRFGDNTWPLLESVALAVQDVTWLRRAARRSEGGDSMRSSGAQRHDAKSPSEKLSNDFITLQSSLGEEEDEERCPKPDLMASVETDDVALTGCNATLRVALSLATASPAPLAVRRTAPRHVPLLTFAQGQGHEITR